MTFRMGSDDDRGTARATVAARQSYVRWVNANLAGDLPYRLSDELNILCECGDRRCSEWITLTNAAYKAARSDSSWYIVALGHEVPELAGVTRRHATYTVVESRGDSADWSRRV